MALKIGQLGKATGTNTETIRYYERIGLLPKAGRTDGNYRNYDVRDVERLTFIRHARGLGFEIADILSLLELSESPDQDCSEADRIASQQLTAVKRKIGQLTKLQAELKRMISQCRGGQISDCRIMLSLADHEQCMDDHA